MIHILQHKDIEELKIPLKNAYKWVQQTLVEKGNTILPPKISMVPFNSDFYNIMPSIIPYLNVSGVKIVTRYNDRIPTLDSQIFLYDLEHGKLKAILDGNYITTLRTGAVAAHSIKLLAIENFQTIGLIGLGNQARSAMKVLLSLYDNKKFKIKLLKYKEQHLEFIDYLETVEHNNTLEFVVEDNYEDVVRDSDVIISSVTYAEKDLCDASIFKKGCLLVPIHTRGFLNCDLVFDKIFADDFDHVKHFEHFDEFKYFSEISDVINGVKKGRENDEEKIIAYNIGLSIHDIAFASEIYKIAMSLEVGKDFQLEAPNEKIWFK